MTPELRAYFFNNPTPLINFISKSLKANPRGFVLFEAENYDFEIDLTTVQLNNPEFYVEHIMDLIKISLILNKCTWGFFAKKMQFQDNKLVWQTFDKWKNTCGAYIRINNSQENVDLVFLSNGKIRARYRDLFQTMIVQQNANKTTIEFGSYKWCCDFQDGKFYDHDVLKESTTKMNLQVAIIYLLNRATKDLNFGWSAAKPS